MALELSTLKESECLENQYVALRPMQVSHIKGLYNAG
ncbi:MAG: hypothetical protein ACI9UT_000906 [Flavobacteriales bacterium]|jgi:hypothetical protein